MLELVVVAAKPASLPYYLTLVGGCWDPRGELSARGGGHEGDVRGVVRTREGGTVLWPVICVVSACAGYLLSGEIRAGKFIRSISAEYYF
ncbi:hypothetical protein PF005_g9188 [Phytophthora fragariae]|uniref:Uncharacterized protein n=1 Tax=Phytophthora fragariae TaxID=53985 RepID=A0A6A3YCV7_9STRA|nr:hypothetical protein PF009_g10009 [Phytophthora fragariae]KAE9002328.1 hypothetical protein PF011_g13367 [Phytophthora fragariae]KAE9116393.1 hypothetical protein PF010_g8986 [Phytophthora fragariae]KAE9146450.1 hypothetical protein PF006_g8780 [Phytophthora fragariae]KAE9216142.1 hypothetical protein PF005_g9188 [Phytophthora fragariae]